MSIKLWCFVPGSKDSFCVAIDRGNFIFDLKEAIKEKKRNDFSNVDANRLVLWQVDIIQEQVMTAHIDGMLKDENKLKNSATIEGTFGNIEGTNVRVIVVPIPTGES